MFHDPVVASFDGWHVGLANIETMLLCFNITRATLAPSVCHRTPTHRPNMLHMHSEALMILKYFVHVYDIGIVNRSYHGKAT